MGNIVVLVKAALNPEMVRPGPGGGVDVDSIPLKLSDIDRNAVEEAARLKKELGWKVYAVSVLTWGPMESRIREARMAVQEALAKGADEAIIVADEGLLPGDPVTTSTAIIAALRKTGVKPDLILAGEATIDETTSQVPGRVAAKLGYSYVSFARRIEVRDGYLVAERDLERYVETIEVPLPAVVSVTQEINQPRPPTLLQIRRASRKPVRILSLNDLDGVVAPKREIVEMRIVQVNRKQVIIKADSLDEAAEKLIEALEREGIIGG